jgi:polyisoprenoid-binding protein YceI
MQKIRGRVFLVALAGAAVWACSSGEARQTHQESVSAATGTVLDESASSAQPQGEALRLVLYADGSSANYRVRERLVGHDLPNDAIGKTKALSGSIAIDSSGKVIPQSSKFVVDAATLVSDQNRRDGFVRGRLLEADSYPEIVLVPTAVRGITLPLPTSGSLPFEMAANLTVRGVTRPTVWKGIAQFQSRGVIGSAATAFTFADMQMEQPRIPVLMSVADTIGLEISFNLVRQP